jgi:hypothetical protein
VVGVSDADPTAGPAYESYAGGHNDARFTNRLRERAGGDWTAATGHRFTRELDREGAAATPRRQRRLDSLFGHTVELEVAFFEAAYDPEVSVAKATAPDVAGGSDGGG